MALEFSVLERFSREVRERVAERAFSQRSEDGGAYVCKRGLCVMGALIHEVDPNIHIATPDVPLVGAVIGTEKMDDWHEIAQIMSLNDNGKLRTHQAVRALLLEEGA